MTAEDSLHLILSNKPEDVIRQLRTGKLHKFVIEMKDTRIQKIWKNKTEPFLMGRRSILQISAGSLWWMYQAASTQRSKSCWDDWD